MSTLSRVGSDKDASLRLLTSVGKSVVVCWVGGAPILAGTSMFIMWNFCTHMKCEVKHMGIWEWGIYGLKEWGIYDLNGRGIYGLNGCGRYGKVSCCFRRKCSKLLVWGAAICMLDHKQSELGTGRGSYGTVLESPIVLPKVSAWVSIVLWQLFFQLSTYTSFKYLVWILFHVDKWCEYNNFI